MLSRIYFAQYVALQLRGVGALTAAHDGGLEAREENKRDEGSKGELPLSCRGDGDGSEQATVSCAEVRIRVK